MTKQFGLIYLSLENHSSYLRCLVQLEACFVTVSACVCVMGICVWVRVNACLSVFEELSMS